MNLGSLACSLKSTLGEFHRHLRDIKYYAFDYRKSKREFKKVLSECQCMSLASHNLTIVSMVIRVESTGRDAMQDFRSSFKSDLSLRKKIAKEKCLFL